MIGVQTGEGIVLAAEKRVTSTLLISSSIEKVVQVDKHIGMALSGLSADSRTLIDHARLEAANHTFVYDEPMPVESITRSVSDLALRFGEGIEGQETIMVTIKVHGNTGHIYLHEKHVALCPCSVYERFSPLYRLCTCFYYRADRLAWLS